MKGSDSIKDFKKKMLLLKIILILAMSISAIYAMNSEMTNGVISTGVVDIKIDTYKIDSGQEVSYGGEKKNVTQGEVVSIIPKIINCGESCFVRVKVNYVNSNIDFKNYVTNFSSDLNKVGEYYYYDKVLEPNESIKLFDTIKIPDNIYDLITGNEVKLEIIAEAIQDKNFEPDYTLTDPWKNVNPTKCINTSYNIDTEGQYSKIDIKYEDGINNDIIIPEEFFEDLKTAMPGDTFVNYLKIKNSNKKSVKYFLNLQAEDTSNAKNIELLSFIDLTITNQEGKEIYAGKLLNQDKILLGKYSLEEGDKLAFKVSVPNDLDNRYVNLNPKLSLVFTADYEKEKQDEEKHIKNPITGDSIDWAITIFLLSSIGLIVVILVDYFERRNIDSINEKNFNLNIPNNGKKGEKHE